MAEVLESLGTGEYSTIAGIVFMHLGRIRDTPGDVVELEGWNIEVLEVAHHAVTKVCVRANPGRPAHSED